MDSDTDRSVTSQMLEQGLLALVDRDAINPFLDAKGLKLLFFAGPGSVRRESHDVAVALRELLRSYGPAVTAGLVDPDVEAELQQRCRVPATPCLVFLAGSEVLEVLPRVRDWADYAAAFHRYLGTPVASGTTGDTV